MAPISLPRFDSAAMDGQAVRGADLMPGIARSKISGRSPLGRARRRPWLQPLWRVSEVLVLVRPEQTFIAAGDRVEILPLWNDLNL